VSVDQQHSFDQRLSKIMRDRGGDGSFTQVTADGAVRRQGGRRRLALFMPWKSALMIVSISLVFKAFLLAYLGDEGYGERLALLETGSAADRAGALLLAPDRLTITLAGQISPMLK